MADAKWYVIQTYSGYENTVKATIEKTVESRQLQEQILAISIPTETVTEKVEKVVKDELGQPKTVSELRTYERKIYPSYVLIKMAYSNEVWHIIRNIRGVTGFLGDPAKGSTKSQEPIALTEEEVYAMGVEKREVILDYQEGDTVRIYEGVFKGQLALVKKIDVDNDLVYLSIKMANRQTDISPLPLNAVEFESH